MTARHGRRVLRTILRVILLEDKLKNTIFDFILQIYNKIGQ